MGIVNSALNTVFDLLFAPLRGMTPWAAMLAVSLLAGLLMIFIYKLTSNQEGILRTKNLIKAHLLELRLYKDSLGTSVRSYGGILWCNLKYVGHALRPLAVMIIPILLILVQLNSWFGYRPLEPGESFLLKAKLAEGRDPMQVNLEVVPSPAYEVETPALRQLEELEITWRLKARDAGRHEIGLKVDERSLTKSLAVGGKALNRLSPIKPGGGFIDRVFNPSEAACPKDLGLRSVEVVYPEARLELLGIRFHWLVAFFLLSIIFGFALKGVFRVEI